VVEHMIFHKQCETSQNSPKVYLEACHSYLLKVATVSYLSQLNIINSLKSFISLIKYSYVAVSL